MDTNTTLIDLQPEQTERLRGALKILIEYLLEHGQLTSEQQPAVTKEGLLNK